ncbi:Proton/sodium-glutamate symport protein [Aquicella siphonis]|uniref:Proton/sodium-glutamate symport protein n=1 Tax=Aquicella siphonis TaxID=254247 RepID=A0A5E4PHB4_9COXI|nr:dicarboxylate/amino acid:cation symporter [Aquicella siphonis]VVC75842.1 Proton/sodium-glutamate symport protein [Aquicella siphonis]
MAFNARRFKVYVFPAALVFSILSGGLAGAFLGPRALFLKPFGDIFLNLLLAAVVPLVFFSISSAVSHLRLDKLLKILLTMLAAFLFTGLVAAIFMFVIVRIFPPAQGVLINLSPQGPVNTIHLSDQLVNMLSVPDFTELLSHKNMLPLILFSLLVGLATASAGDKGRPFAVFLQAGTEVFMHVIRLIMYYAPIGFFAYFAVMAADLGPRFLTSYVRAICIYYVSASIYFILAFTWYAWLAGGILRVKLFWGHVYFPMMTAFATCSSAASIPANLQATRNMGVADDICETVVPLGAMLHKDGSVLGAVLKIAFLFGIFGLSLSGPADILSAIGIAILVGTVMGAIPSGGMLGEMLIISTYGFPSQTLIMIAAISIMIDPLATMLNVTGDSVCSMLVERWIKKEGAR